MKKSTLVYIVISAILFSLVLLILYLYSKKQLTGKVQKQPRSIPTISLVDPNTGWKIYKNDKFNFEIQYPTDYISEFESDLEKNIWYLQTIHSTDYRKSADDEPETFAQGYFIFGFSNDNCKTISTIDDTPTTIIKNIDTKFNQNILLLEKEGHVGYLYPYRAAFIDYQNSSCIQIRCISSESGCSDNELGNNFTKMLSTFKFN